jgi:hypothetical protein
MDRIGRIGKQLTGMEGLEGIKKIFALLSRIRRPLLQPRIHDLKSIIL